ncbi:hypothetical protein BKA01_001554 [Pseudonocardia eucalypti]|uniref:hypothetical protein n=1 Tax=Pseudonocardia eucalypti TaxID=648755 RepID=UPI0018542C8F|nr:hypothetical protein [Pseudonocardia eucalypti]
MAAAAQHGHANHPAAVAVGVVEQVGDDAVEASPVGGDGGWWVLGVQREVLVA